MQRLLTLRRRFGFGLIAALMTFASFGASVHAQNALPQQPYLPLNLALEAANAALAQCQADGHRVSVAVVDRNGVTKVLLRDDGTGPHTVSSSTRKAYTSASLGRPTGELAATVAANAELEGLRQMDPQLLLLAGGLPIVVEETVVGGIGVGGAPGGQLDAACAQAGVDAIMAATGAAPEAAATDAAAEEAEATATQTPAEEPEATPTTQS